VTGAAFAALLEREGFDVFAGVPCSLAEDLIAALEAHPRLPYVETVREDVAAGLAGGAWLGGRRPVVVMQNSGLGTSLNALTSFSLMYGLPALLVVTWRGQDGKDAPEHVLSGAITEPLLGLIGIPHRVLSPASAEADVRWARAEMDARMQPIALLVPKGTISAGGGSTVSREASPGRGEGEASARRQRLDVAAPARPADGEDLVPKISRFEAIRTAMKEVGDAAVVSANGYPSREAFGAADRPLTFYMIGSMGLASSIALGVALARPARRTVVLDGDGNVLMNLGALANVAALAPRNFVHCVFDNEAYGSTGNQRSASAHVRLDRVAAAAGYRTVAAATDAEGVAGALRAMLAADGPHFLLVKVTREEADVPRISHSPHAIRDRFRAALGGS
jgi:phosphonopyruvate decarboxylase